MTQSFSLTRRGFLAGSVALTATSLAGCASDQQSLQARTPAYPPDIVEMYAAVTDEPYYIPAVDLARFPSQWWRRVVPDPTGERPGTVVVNTGERYLYLVRDDGTAIRYGVGVGRDGFAWSGRGYVAYKKEWPTWTPPAAMIAREPELAQYRHGMAPGLDNPLGARALYIFQNGHDTQYRLHGNPNETSIGHAVSSGCIRLLDQDVIDLYSRVPVNTDILVV